jgi:hypothetical protein
LLPPLASSKPRLSRRPAWTIACVLAISLGALALYAYTALPGPGWVDSGELAVVSHTLGIPHPTGSPLYVVVSRLATLLSPSEFWPLTLLSALAVAAAVALVMLSLPVTATSTAMGWVVLSATGVLAALAPSLWELAVLNEVYALQALLFALFLHLRTRTDSARRDAGSAFVAGLAFANHQSALFLAPFLIAVVWKGRRLARTWVSVFGFGLLGVSLYLLLPIRSQAGPLLDWGGTHRLSAFLRHVMGWQYKNWVGLQSWQAYGSALTFALQHVAGNLAYAGIPLAVLGWWELRQRSRALAGASAFAFGLCLAFGVNFPNPDLEAFYLLLYILCAFWAGLGLVRLVRLRPAWGVAAALVICLCAGYQTVIQFPAANARTFRVPTHWVEDALDTIEPGAVVLTREWDHYSPWLYLRWVKKLRPDVTWIDTELLRRSWYPEYLRKADSARYLAALPALLRLAPQIEKFESGSPYNPQEIEGAYADAIYALSLGQEGPVHVDGIGRGPGDWGVERAYFRGATEVPWGLTMRLFRPGERVPPLPEWPQYRNRPPTPHDSPRTRFHLELYRRMLDARSQIAPAG